jgi:DNA ligase 1
MSLLDQISALQTAKGKEKLTLLQDWRGDEVLKNYLYRVYEPTLSYFFKPLKGATAGVTERLHPDFSDGMVLGAISHFLTLRGHAARDMYLELVEAMDEPTKKLFDYILHRDVKAGIAASTINKVWPGLITDVPYMRCATVEKGKPSAWPWGKDGFSAVAQLKADGMYANICVAEGVANGITSRNGNRFPQGPWCEPILSDLRVAEARRAAPHVYNGELVVFKDGKPLPRQIGNGILNSLLNEGEWTGEDGMVVRFLAWDSLPLSEYNAGTRYKTPYKERLEALLDAVCLGRYVSVIESKVVTTYEEALEDFMTRLAAGEEGTVLKRGDAIWMDGDSMEQVKMKVEFDCDLRVTGLNPGDPNGRHANTFGSLQCESACGKLAVGVSGMKDDLRKKISDNPGNYLGAIVRVTANDVMPPDAKTGISSLFLPRLDEFRSDKSNADDLDSILAALASAKGLANG